MPFASHSPRWFGPQNAPLWRHRPGSESDPPFAAFSGSARAWLGPGFAGVRREAAAEGQGSVRLRSAHGFGAPLPGGAGTRLAPRLGAAFSPRFGRQNWDGRSKFPFFSRSQGSGWRWRVFPTWWVFPTCRGRAAAPAGVSPLFSDFCMNFAAFDIKTLSVRAAREVGPGRGPSRRCQPEKPRCCPNRRAMPAGSGPDLLHPPLPAPKRWDCPKPAALRLPWYPPPPPAPAAVEGM